MSFIGAFAERVAVPEAQLRLTRDGLRPDLACLTGSTYRTAYDALVSTARVASGDDVVILGASGAVGSAGITVAKALGARVVACASTPAKLEFCRELGADELITSRTRRGAINGGARPTRVPPASTFGLRWLPHDHLSPIDASPIAGYDVHVLQSHRLAG